MRWPEKASRGWKRHHRLAIALGVVPLVLVLAVVGAGWDMTFEPSDRSSPGAQSGTVLETPDFVVWPFVVLGVMALVALLALIIRDRGWTGFLVIALLVMGLVGLGILGGRAERGDAAPEPETSVQAGDVSDVPAARSPRLIVILALVGASVVAAMCIVTRGPEEMPDAEELSDVVAEIALELDSASRSPRQNIITMYSDLETRLAGGLNARRRSETTAEFSARVLLQLGANAEACSELALLYQLIGFGEREARDQDQVRAGQLLMSISADLAVSGAGVGVTDA